MDPVAPSSTPAPRSRGKNLLYGCLAGCGGLALVMIGSCVGFIWWLHRPGELLQPSQLRGSDTAAYVEWTLRLEDPGTEALIDELFASLRELEAQSPDVLPGGLDEALRQFQGRRNERRLRELFPCVVAWTEFEGQRPGQELQLITVSVEKLGNRLVFADWILGLLLRNARDVDVVDYRGERIYHLEREGSAFFLRRSDFFFTTDVDAARRAVDRLQPGAVVGAGGTLVDRLIDGLPAELPLRGAVTNEHGEAQRLFAWLTEDEELGALGGGDPWASVRALSLAGGFAEDASFRATLEVSLDGGGWSEDQARAVADALSRSLGGESLPVEVEAETGPGNVRFDVTIQDLVETLRRRAELD